jgi:hypothetical protein
MKSVWRNRFIVKLFLAVAVSAIAADHGAATRLPISPKGTFAPLTIAVVPATVVGGNRATATITLSAPAATNLEITLKSSNNDVAQFGAHFQAIGTSQLTIPQGNIQATFPLRTFGVLGPTTVKLQAISGSDVGEVNVTVNPATPKTLTINPGSVIGSNTATGTVTLDGLAPPNSGLMLPLTQVREAAPRQGTSSSGLSQAALPIHSDSAISIPATINVPAGSSSATFSISTNPVASDISIRIAAGGRQSGSTFTDGTSNTVSLGESAGLPASATLTIQAPKVSAISLNPASVPGGMGSIGTVMITGPAPTGGLPVSIGTFQNFQNTWGGNSNSAIVPSQILVPAGANTSTFKISTQATTNSQTVTLHASTLFINGQLLPYLEDGSVRNLSTAIPSTVAQAVLSITPTPPPFTISVQPAQVVGGTPVTVSIALQPSATTVVPLNSLSLSSNHPELLLLPNSVSTSGGNTISVSPAPIPVNANTLFATADQTVTITATGGSVSASTPLLIKHTPPIASFILRATTVTGGQNIIGQLLLVNNATAPVNVSLTTNYPQFVTVPATITIPNSPVPTPITFKTSAPPAATTVSITASAGGQTLTQTISLVP